MKVAKQILVSLFVTLVTAGCAIVNVTNEPGLAGAQTRSLPSLVSHEPVSVDLALHTRYLVNGQLAKFKSFLLRKGLQLSLETEVRRFPSLREARFEVGDAEYQIRIEAVRSVHYDRFRSVLALLSFDLIPTQMNIAFQLKAAVYRGERLLKSYEAKEMAEAHFHLFHVFLPKGWRSLAAMGYTRTVDDLLFQIERDADELFKKEK